MKALLFILATSGMIGAPPANSLEVKATVVLPEGGAKVGTPFSLVIEARHAPGAIALLPETLPLPEVLAERREARKLIRTGDETSELDRFELEIVAFDAGRHALPAIEVAVGSTVAKTQPLEVDIVSGLSEDELRVASSTLPEAIAELEKMAAPNPPPQSIIVEDYSPLYWVAGLLGIVLAVLLARIFYRKVKRARRPLLGADAPPPPRPAEVIALERLEVLRRSEFLARGDYKGYYADLSETLRAYLGRRYAFDSVELTVQELSTALRGMRTPGLDLAILVRVLEEADLAKFAKYTPGDNAAHSALNAAFEIVERTTPPKEDVRAA